MNQFLKNRLGKSKNEPYLYQFKESLSKIEANGVSLATNLNMKK